MKLEKLLNEKSNDYSEKATKYKKLSGQDVVFGKCPKTVKQNISIVIPFYYSQKTINIVLDSILNQKKFSGRIEIIIVNDSPEEDCYIKKAIWKKVPITLITCRENHGAGVARNIGLAHASFQFVLFMDSDTLLDTQYLQQHLSRHELLMNIVTISMRKKITASSLSALKKRGVSVKRGDYDDFRYFKKLNNLFDEKLRNNDSVKLLESTDYFRLFGNGKKVLLWTLPMMLTTHNVLLRRNIACRIGGFNPIFKGAQWEDTAFGANLIAANQYIVPILSTGVISVDEKNDKKRIFFMENEIKYEKLLKSAYRKLSSSDKFIKKYKSRKLITSIRRME